MAPQRRRRLLPAGVLAALGLLAAFLAYGYWEAGQLRVVELELSFANLPPAFNGFRILHLSDLHTSGYGRVERRLRRILENTPADMLVFTGDFKASLSTDDEAVYASLDRIFAGMEFPWGLVAIPGGHDTPPFYERLPTRSRFHCLLRSSLLLHWQGQSLALLGVATLWPNEGLRGEHEIDEATWTGNVVRHNAPWGLLPDDQPGVLVCDPLARGETFRILLAHTPDFILRARDAGIDLVLAGDTHGGQVCLPFHATLLLKTPLSRRYAYGHFTEGGTQMVVTRGIGTHLLPIRFLCPPEVVILTLRRSQPAPAKPLDGSPAVR